MNLCFQCFLLPERFDVHPDGVAQMQKYALLWTRTVFALNIVWRWTASEWVVCLSLSPRWITPSFVSFPSGGNHIKWSPVFGSSLSCLNGSHLDGEEKYREEWGRKHPHNTNSAQQKHPLPFLRIHLHSNIPSAKYEMWKSLSYFCAWSSWDAVWACLGCLRLPAPQSSRPPTLGLQWHNVYLSHSKAKESERESGAKYRCTQTRVKNWRVWEKPNSERAANREMW